MLLVTFFYLFLDCKHVLMKTFFRIEETSQVMCHNWQHTLCLLSASSTCQNIHQGGASSTNLKHIYW